MTDKTYTHEEVNQILINAAATEWSDMRRVIASTLSGSNYTGDTLHNVAADYGYPETLEFANYWNMYRRFGIANAVVELPIDTGWMTPPEVKGSTQFDKELEVLIKNHKLWQRLKGLDVRQRVGRYAGLFMQVRDGKKPDQPIESKLSGTGVLVKMIPLYESQLEVTETEGDPTKDNFGDPKFYVFNSTKAGNRDKNNNSSFNIHPSRVIIASEGADDGSIYGISSLEAPFNSLMDLRKIIGAGGEGFYKNAAKDVMFNIKDLAGAKVNSDLITDFNAQYDDWVRNRARRSMLTPGLEANVLQSDLANPKEFFFNAMYDVSASTKIPATIIIGQQTGRLASGEDSDHFLSLVQSRNENFTTEMVAGVIDWCIKWGVLPSSEYEVEWEDLTASTDDDKLNNAERLSSINEKQFKSGQGTVFSGEEIREAAGYEDEELPESSEEIDDIPDVPAPAGTTGYE